MRRGTSTTAKAMAVYRREDPSVILALQARRFFSRAKLGGDENAWLVWVPGWWGVCFVDCYFLRIHVDLNCWPALSAAACEFFRAQLMITVQTAWVMYPGIHCFCI